MRSILLTALLALVACTVDAQQLDLLLNGFDQRREQADQTRDDQLGKLNASYTTALRRLLDRIRAGGNLDAVRPVNDEITAIEDGAVTLPPLPETAPAEFKKLRATYEDSRHKTLKNHATTLTDLAAKLDAALKKLEADLTRAGKIDSAVATRAAREELAKDQALNDARDLLKLGGNTGNGKPALQLRRYGDNLEVLVFYDRAGKISMDSPVENTRERTGEGKELGDTKAKVLGEFVGAKGYTVDPYVAYQHTFNTKDTGGLVLGEILPEFNHEVEASKGLKLSYTPGAVNPHGYLGKIIPGNAAKGTYRISSKYFIPKSNNAITGFYFIQCAGMPIGRFHFNKTAKWITEEIIAESCHDFDTLIFYLELAPDRKVADAKDDFIVLSEIKVEHLRFSAYLQKRLETSAKPENEQNNPLLQQVFITNGEFAAKQ